MIKDLKLDSHLIGHANNDFDACSEKEDFLQILWNSIPEKVSKYNSEGTCWDLGHPVCAYRLYFNRACMNCTDYVDGIGTFLVFLTQLAYYDDKSLMCSYDDEGVQNIMIAQPQGGNYFRISIFEQYNGKKLLGDFVIKKDTFLQQISQTFEEINTDWAKIKETEPNEFKEWDFDKIQQFLDYMKIYFEDKEEFRKNYNPIKYIRVFDIAYKKIDGIWDFCICLDDDERADIEYWENQKHDGKILDFDYTEQTPTSYYILDKKQGRYVSTTSREEILDYLEPNMDNRVEERNWVYSTEKQKWYATNEIMDMPDERPDYLQYYQNLELEIASSEGWTLDNRIESYFDDTDEEKGEFGSLECLLYIKDGYYQHKAQIGFEFDYGYQDEIKMALKKLKNNENVRFNLDWLNKMHIWLQDRHVAGRETEENALVKVAVFQQNANNLMKSRLKCYFEMDKAQFIKNVLSILDEIEEKIQKVKRQLEIKKKLDLKNTFTFDDVENFKDDYAVVNKSSLDGYGIINKKGEWVNEAQHETIYGDIHPKYGIEMKEFIAKYTYLENVNSEFFIAQKDYHNNKEKFVIDVDGDVKIPRVSEEIYYGYLNNELYFLFADSDKTTITNSKGEDILELDYTIGRVFYLLEDIIICSKDEKFGIVDWQGNLIFEFILDEVKFDPENSDFIPARYEEKWGFIDKKGRLKEMQKTEDEKSWKINYDLRNFYQNKAFIHKEGWNRSKFEIGNYICINTDGELLFELPDKEMIPVDFEHKEVTSVLFHDNYALINSEGKFLTDFIYNHIICLENVDFCEVLKDKKHGVINIEGKEIIPCIYDSCYDLSNEYAVLCLNGKWGITDLNNNTIIPFEYEGLWECYNGLIPTKLNNKWGLINLKNEVVIDFIYDELFSTIEETNGVYIAKKDEKYGVIDKDNNILEPIIYDEYLGDMELYAFKKDNKYALYSSLNRQFITDFIYETSIRNNEGKAIYHNNFGLMDVWGKSAIKLDYDEFFEEYFDRYGEDIAIISQKGLCGAIDKNWNLVIPFEYAKLERCSNGLIWARKTDDSEGYLDKNNNAVIPFGKYEGRSTFHCGMAKVYAEEEGSVYINTKGEIVEIKNKVEL